MNAIKQLKIMAIETMPENLQDAIINALKAYTTDCISEMQAIDAELAERSFDVKDLLRRNINDELTYHQTNMVEVLMSALAESIKNTMTQDEIDELEELGHKLAERAN